MMKMTDSRYHNFDDMCRSQVGGALAEKLIVDTNNLLNQLIAQVDDGGNAIIRNHMNTNMLPTIAYYKALIHNRKTKEEAYDLVLAMSLEVARKQAKKNAIVGSHRFTYLKFLIFCHFILDKKFTDAGWKKTWVTRNMNMIHVNMCECIYLKITKQLGCEEMCTIFCKNDPVRYAGYEPSIIFQRNGTIAEGNSVCDFKFYNGRRYMC